MLDNHVYNLLEQLSQEHKSLYRIKNIYTKDDAAECEECVAFWEKTERGLFFPCVLSLITSPKKSIMKGQNSKTRKTPWHTSEVCHGVKRLISRRNEPFLLCRSIL